MASFFQLRWLPIFLVLIAVPFAIHVEVETEGTSHANITIPLADPVIWLIASILLASSALRSISSRDSGETEPVVQRQSFKGWAYHCLTYMSSIPWLPFVIVLGMSVFANGMNRASTTDLLQTCDYCLIWYWIVSKTCADNPKGNTTNPLLFLATLIVGLFIVIAQFQIWCGFPTYFIQALFRDRQSFLCSCVILIPVVWCWATCHSNRKMVAAGHVFIGISCATLGSLGTMLLTLGQCWLASLLIGGKWLQRSLIVTVTAAIIFLTLPSSFRMEVIQQPQSWIEVSLANRRREVIQTKQFAAQANQPRFHFGFSKWHFFWGWNAFPISDPNEAIAQGVDSDKTDIVVAEYYAESWAGLQLIQDNPLIGTGPGSWQPSIGTAFRVLERTGTTFPNTINGYLYLGVTTGFLGIVAWCYAIRSTLVGCYSQMIEAQSQRKKSILASTLCSILGTAIFMLVYPLPTQSVMVGCVFLSVWVRKEVWWRME